MDSFEPGLVADHWLIHCTNTGQGMDGSAPTGRTFTFKGASIIQVEGDKILSDQCYFDRLALAEPLSPSDVGFYAEAGRYTKRRYALKAGCVPALAGDVRAGGQGFALHAKGGEGAKALALATHIPQ